MAQGVSTSSWSGATPSGSLGASRIRRRPAGFLPNHPAPGGLFVPRAVGWVDGGTPLEPDLRFVRGERQRRAGPGRHRSAALVAEAVFRSTEVDHRQIMADRCVTLSVAGMGLVASRRQEIAQLVLEGGPGRAVAVAASGDTSGPRSYRAPQ